jgi:PAS domain S-box-containing protein
MKVLIVEDKEENRYLLEALLKGNGHDVEAVANGAEAFERLKSGAFELIISDILMPVMDGFQLCRKVKSDEALHRIPFIIYTATYTGPQDEAFAIKIGADRFIQKPCEPEVFMEAVRDVTAAAGRRDIASTPAPVDEEEMLKLYSERLARKLEQKMLQLEKEVHARREAEEILRASGLKYRLLADNTLDVIWTMDQNLTFTYVNPAIQSLMGYSPGEWIGSPLSEHCDEENYAKMVRVIADETAKGADGTGVIVQAVLLNKNREPIPFEIHGKMNYDKKGEPAGLQGVAREISERKRAEDALKESEEKYRLLVENASEVVLVARDGRVEFINSRVLGVLGYKPEELIGTSFVDYVHPEDRETVAEQHVKRLKGEHVPPVYSFRVIDKAGETKWAQVSAIRIDWKGKLATLNFLTDITERKKAEQALREAYDIINSSSSVAFTWKNQEGWPVEFVSENVERLLGYTAEEFMKGKVSYADCVHPAYCQRVAKEVAKYSKDEEMTEFIHEPYCVIGKDGSEKIVNDWTYIVRDNDGCIIHYKGIVEDITERKQSEEERHRLRSQLHQAQKMEAIGTLAGGIAHDFNNILSAIMGYTQLCVEKIPRGSALGPDLGEVLSAARRATELVKQILTFSRQTAKEEQPVQVELIVREALKLLRASLPTTIEIRRDIRSKSLVVADPSQIHQVVMNLCVNAGHAMEKRGGHIGNGPYGRGS